MPSKKVAPINSDVSKGKRRAKKQANGHVDGLYISPPNSGRGDETYHLVKRKKPSFSKSQVLDLWNSVTTPVGGAAKWKEFVTRRRELALLKGTPYRDGPAPRIQLKGDKGYQHLNMTHSGIDSDFDEESDHTGSYLPATTDSKYSTKEPAVAQSDSKTPNASNRALIIYFSKLASGQDERDEIDLNFVESLLLSGADIDTSDRFGQTVLHEVARAWHTDVAEFMLQHNANVNKGDRYGRTPLHVAAAVDYPKMIQFLVNNGADINARTYEEYQTPIHYAAKNDAVQALKVLIQLGASVHEQDYKGRTPLQVSAELDRSETAKYLIAIGAPAGVCDNSGLPVMSLMVEKMPLVAKEALGQFHTTERANRKQYYFLNYLEPRLPGQEMLAKQPLQHTVDSKQMELLLHPVMQRLIDVKWRKFGKFGCWKQLIIQLIFVIVWTAVGLSLPKDFDYYPSKPFKEWWYRVVLETIALLMTFYYIIQELLEFRTSSRSHGKWQEWRTTELKRDLHYCHPRWPEERKYLEQELERVEETTISYFRDSWNIFDWITYFWVFSVIITRMVSVWGTSSLSKTLHPRILAITLIFIWFRMMKVIRAFRSLGPFIVMISHIFTDILKFGFLYFEIFIPYVCAFWIIFGGSINAAKMTAAGQSSKDWKNLNDLIYTVWIITVGGDFTFESLTAVDRLMAQILVGTYVALCGVVMLNLFIALMSDTFQRVYDNAKANAILQQAFLILSVEQSLSKGKRDKFRRYLHCCCSPEEAYYDDDDTVESGELEKMTIQIKEVVDEIDEAVKLDLVEGGLKAHFDTEFSKLKEDTHKRLEEYNRSLKMIHTKIDTMNRLLADLLGERPGSHGDSKATGSQGIGIGAELPERIQTLPPPSELSESFRLRTNKLRDTFSPSQIDSAHGHKRVEQLPSYGPSEETLRQYRRRPKLRVSRLTSGVEDPEEGNNS